MATLVYVMKNLVSEYNCTVYHVSCIAQFEAATGSPVLLDVALQCQENTIESTMSAEQITTTEDFVASVQ